MLANGKENLTAEQIKKILAPPPLIRGESEEAYWNWWEAFAKEYEPESLTDWLEVDQLATKQWEQNRLSRCNSMLIDGALFVALKELLRPFFIPVVAGRIIAPSDGAAATARDYYFGNDKEKEQARKKVQAWGITDQQIAAEAISLRAKEIVVLDRMDNYRANAKRKGQKELERRSEARRNSPESGTLQ